MASSHHWLKPNETCRTPTSLAFLGVEYAQTGPEAAGGKAALSFGRAALTTIRTEKGRPTRQQTSRHDDCRSLWDRLYSCSANDRTTWVFTYDALHSFHAAGLWAEVEADKLWLRWKGDKGRQRLAHPASGPRRKPGFLCVEDRPYVVELLHGRGRLRLLDVRNYFDATLEDLRTNFLTADNGGGREAGGSDGGLRPAELTALTCRAAVLKLLDWWREVDGGVWKSTASGLAWNNFRHRHLTIGICTHSDAEALDLEKRCYYGGVVEARFKGEIRRSRHEIHQERVAGGAAAEGPIYQVDVASMYPSLMRDRTFPRRLVFRRTCRDWAKEVDSLASLARAYGLCAVVQLDTPFHPYPVRIDGRTCHAYGRFWSCLCGPELRHALDNGCVRRVAEFSAYSVGRLFAGYADYWIRQRERHRAERQPVRERFAKLMANSLYGRFAARKRRWTDRPDLFTDMRWGSWPTRSICRGHELDGQKQCAHCGRQGGLATRNPVVSFRSVAGYVQEMSRDELANGAFPAISAWVSSYGRLLLRSLLDCCPPKSVYYVDTDGILCSRSAVDALNPVGQGRPAAAGEVRIVREVAAGEVVGCRAYRLGDEWLTAGLPADREARPEGGWKFQSKASAAELLAKEPDGTVRVVERTFCFDPWHRSDRRDPDGWLVPLTLDQADVLPF